MIVIYINGEGTATRLTPQHVYQGSNQSGVLVFAPVPPQTAMGIAFSLPDKTSTPYYPMTYQGMAEGLAQYEFTLPTSITQLSGQASIAIQATFSDGQQNSQLIDFEIEKSVVVVPPEPLPDVYDLLKQEIAKNASDIAGIQGQIDNIEDLAEKAEQASENAVNTANEAKATADGLADSIAQANATAQEAVDTANAAVEDIAKYKNDTDSDIAQFKQTVNDEITQFENATDDKIDDITNTANGAVATANEAKQTADGLADSIAQANATADEAKEIAEEALEQSKVTGTQVNINGAFQSELNFDSDPQTQLDNLQGQIDTSWKFRDATAIPANADLNDYKVAGNYAVKANANMPTIKNKPSSLASVFVMKVFSSIGADSDAYPLQLIISFDKQLYLRRYNTDSGQWNDWTEYATVANTVSSIITVEDGATLGNAKSGFYENAYDHYAKSIVVGDSGDKYVLTWDFGGTYQYGLWLRVYNSGKLQYEQRISDGVSTLLAIDTSKLEPTTANGWTVGDGSLAITEEGVYLVRAQLNNAWSDCGIMVIAKTPNTSNLYGSISVNNDLIANYVVLTYSKVSNLSLWRFVSFSGGKTSVSQAAYKRIA